VLKQNLDSHKFKDDCKVGTVEIQWLITADKDFYQQGIEKLFPQYDKSFNSDGGCVAKQWNSNTITHKCTY
jgi:hypothetical protein